MQKLLRCALVAVLVAGSASVAGAGELKLSMADGRVTLIAQEVPIRQILAEWARIGQTKIVNAERLTGPPLTVELIDRPEREVLSVILRSAAGYIAAPRATIVPGLARFDRIMILASSQAPAYSPTAAPPPPYTPRPNTPPMTMPMPDDDPVEPTVLPPGIAPNPNMVPNPNMMPNPNMVPQPGMTLPVNMPTGIVPLQGQPGQVPLTAPRPGMLPPPPSTPVNPFAPNAPIVKPGGRGGPGGDQQ